MPEGHIRKQLRLWSDEPGLVFHRATWGEATAATPSRLVYSGTHFRIGRRFGMTPDDINLFIGVIPDNRKVTRCHADHKDGQGGHDPGRSRSGGP